MAYGAKDFAFLLGMPGFSDTLLKNHFTLYQGYVTNTNKVMELLAGMVKEGKEGTPEFAELKRRQGWEFNGMRLHELYFANLGGDGDMAKAPNLMKKKTAQFGDVATCAIALNAIRTVLEAKPGLRTMADVPLVSWRA